MPCAAGVLTEGEGKGRGLGFGGGARGDTQSMGGNVQPWGPRVRTAVEDLVAGFFFGGVDDAGQPWPPDVCAASTERCALTLRLRRADQSPTHLPESTRGAIDHPRQRVSATRKAICTTAVRMEETIPCTAPGALMVAKEEGLARACGTSSGTYRSCPFSRRTSTLSTPRYQSGRLLKPRHGAGKSRSQSRVGACLSPSTHLRRRRCQTTYSLK